MFEFKIKFYPAEIVAFFRSFGMETVEREYTEYDGSNEITRKGLFVKNPYSMEWERIEDAFLRFFEKRIGMFFLSSSSRLDLFNSFKK